MIDIRDVLAEKVNLGWVIARVKSIDAGAKLTLVIGDVADATAVTMTNAAYVSSYIPTVGDVVHAIVKSDTGILVLGTTTGAGTGFDSRYVNVAGDTMTGALYVPTASAGTNTTQAASTAFVTAADNLKANLASPAFTGTPTAPTAGVNTNTTQLATTAFVVSQIADDAPTKTGGGASGTWAINVTGSADNSDRWDGAHLVWSGQGVLEWYLMSNDGVWFYPVNRGTHGHIRGSSGYNVVHINAGTLSANTAYGPWTNDHGLSGLNALVVAPFQDDGVSSVTGSVDTWAGTSVTYGVRNHGSSAEACYVALIPFI